MEIRVVDIKGKELGKLVLTDEVDEILRIHEVSLMVDYDSKKAECIGYIH